MQVEIDPKNVIANLKEQLAQKAEECAVNAAAAMSAAEKCESLERQLEDAMKEIVNLGGEAQVVRLPSGDEASAPDAEAV